MKTLATAFHRTFLLSAIPAALAVAGCSKSNNNTVAPVIQQAQIQAIHVAPYNKVKIDFLVDDKKVADADYSKSTGYQKVEVGNRVLKVKASANQADIFPSVAQTFEKDKSYSVFVYNPTASTVSPLVLTDDLTTPAAGKSNIRLVHTGFDAQTVTLTSQGVGATPIFPNVTYGTATAFTAVDAKAYTLELRQSGGLQNTLISKPVTFESGKIYTVVVRGRNSPAVPTDEQLTLDIIQNN